MRLTVSRRQEARNPTFAAVAAFDKRKIGTAIGQRRDQRKKIGVVPCRSQRLVIKFSRDSNIEDGKPLRSVERSQASGQQPTP
jgi:hypothetical protein